MSTHISICDMMNTRNQKLLVVVVIVLILGSFIVLNKKEEDKEKIEAPFNVKLVGNKTIDKPLLVQIEKEKLWQYAPALNFAVLAVYPKNENELLPLYYTFGNEIPWAVQKIFDKFGETEVNMSDYGDSAHVASLKLAVDYFSNIDKFILVPDYENALKSVSLATMFQVPIIVDGIYTQDFIDKNDFSMVIIINCNNSQISKIKGTNLIKLNSDEELWSYILENGGGSDYIVATNPNDIDINEDYLINSLSLTSGILSAYYQSLTITGDWSINYTWTQLLGYGTGDAGSGERGGEEDTLPQEEELKLQLLINNKAILLDNEIDKVAQFLKNNSIEPKHLALVGDIAALPMFYILSPIWYEDVNQDEKGEEYIATDSYYNDLEITFDIENNVANGSNSYIENNYFEMDDRLYTQEIAVGRIVARNILDASSLIQRSIGYWKYEYQQGWKAYHHASIITGHVVGNCEWLSPLKDENVFLQNDIIATAHDGVEAGLASTTFMENSVAVAYNGHGYPDGWYPTWASTHDNSVNADRVGTEDVEWRHFPAQIITGAACLSSGLDWTYVWANSNNKWVMDENKYFSLGIIHAGSMGYIGSTEETWGDFVLGGGAFDLTNLFWKYFLGDDLTSGIGLSKGKEEFYKTVWTDDSERPFARVCFLEFVLYGDPAGLPYHPGVQSQSC